MYTSVLVFVPEMRTARIAAGREFFSGSPTWARTRDLRINSPALYRLSYRGTEARILDLPAKAVKIPAEIQ